MKSILAKLFSLLFPNTFGEDSKRNWWKEILSRFVSGVELQNTENMQVTRQAWEDAVWIVHHPTERHGCFSSFGVN